MKATSNRLLPSVCLFMLFFLLFASIQIFLFLKNEHPIYTWDYKGYWMMWQDYANILSDDIGKWVKTIVHSVRYDDYNPLSITLLFPFSHLPFGSRANYLLATSICYLLPVSLLMACVFRRVQGIESRSWFLMVAFFAATYPLFWATIFKGYPDIGGLIAILLLVLYILRVDLSQKISIKSIIIIGILLWLPFGLRRWYAYTLVSLCLTLPWLNFFLFSAGQKKTFRRFAFIALNFCGAGVIAATLVYLFQYDVLKRVLGTDYSHIYGAYNFGSFQSIEMAVSYLGLYILPVFIIGLWWSFSLRRSVAKNFGVFCFVNLIISFILFARTQSPGIQHVLPFSIWVFFICMFGLYWLVEKITTPAVRKILAFGGIAIVLFIHFISFHRMNDQSFLQTPLFPKKQCPLRLENFENYKKMASDIEAHIKAGDKVTIISSGPEFNEALVSTLTEDRIKPYLPPESQVDLTHGLSLERFKNRYVIVGDPVTTSLPSGQNVVTIPSHELLSGTGIGAAYKRLPQEYILSGGKKGIVFEKIRPLTQQELKAFIGQFVALYPQWQDVYMTPLALSSVEAQVTLGDGPWSMFEYKTDGSIWAHPGETQAVEVTWDFGELSQLTVESANPGCREKNYEADGVTVTLESEDGLSKHIEIPYMEAVTIDVREFSHKKGKLSIAPNAHAACDLVKITVPKN